MRRLLPHPVLAAMLVALWLVLAGASPGNLLLGLLVALAGTHTLARLELEVRPVRRWDKVLQLCAITAWDILLSNISVARLILTGGHNGRHSGFAEIRLRLTARAGLSWLAVIVTATPGTAWVAYDPEDGVLLLHVFDLKDPEEWRATIRDRYEALLLEIYA